AAQTVLADHRQGEVDVVGTGQVATRTHESVVVEHVEDAGGRHQDVVLEDRGVRLVATRTSGLTVAAATPTAAAPTAVVVEVVPVIVLAVLVTALVLLAALVL